jgi:hypothetical protein
MGMSKTDSWSRSPAARHITADLLDHDRLAFKRLGENTAVVLSASPPR